MSVRTSMPLMRRKRTQPTISGGIAGSQEDRDNYFSCPVCFNMIEEAYITKCGHSFCHKCISTSLNINNHCPKCNFIIEKKDDIFPNFLLSELIVRQKQKLCEQKRLRMEHFVGGDGGEINWIEKSSLDLAHVNYLMDVLAKKKEALESEFKVADNEILKEFLEKIRERRHAQLENLKGELKILNDDLHRIEDRMTEYQQSPSIVKSDQNGESRQNGIDMTAAAPCASTSASGQEGFNTSRTGGMRWLHTSMASRRTRIEQHFDDLEEVYFSRRRLNSCDGVGSSGGRERLDEFCESLSKVTRYSSFRTLATLNYATDIFNSSSIVSSIEFDRDCDYFAIAGVTKKIKVYEYGAVIRDQVDMHYPIAEMVCNSKISSVIWSSYHKSMLASSDYEGTVTLWDAVTASKSRVFQEHEKRCWSVDFNRMDPKLLASGSDDSKVKLWHTNVEHSVTSLEVKANVCCVKFNPESRYHLAFGSADHCIHYYDLRNPKEPLTVFKGHRKAVSYTKFVNSHEIVSASTDSQLKLWNLKAPQGQCLQTFKGHVNEKNFVGLATDGDYIACGSENNSMYVYYKGLSKHLLTFKFDAVRSVIPSIEKKEEESSEFVSSVCWRANSNVVVAANSQGIIKVQIQYITLMRDLEACAELGQTHIMLCNASHLCRIDADLTFFGASGSILQANVVT